MATPYAHAFRNLNVLRVLDYVPTYEQLRAKPWSVVMGPMVWMRQSALFDLFHKPLSTTKYMAFMPATTRASIEILADHKKRIVKLGSYNYWDFRTGILMHVALDVFPFSRWGRCLWEHTDVERIRAMVKQHGRCRPQLWALSKSSGDPRCRALLRAQRAGGQQDQGEEVVHAVRDGLVSGI